MSASFNESGKILLSIDSFKTLFKSKGIFKPFVKLFHAKHFLFINPLLRHALSNLNVRIQYTFLLRVEFCVVFKYVYIKIVIVILLDLFYEIIKNSFFAFCIANYSGQDEVAGEDGIPGVD